jgi:uncharacterized protein with beta-barrel porin domain
MRPRPSARACGAAAAVSIALLAAPGDADAQTAPPPPAPLPNVTDNNAQLAAGASQFAIGSSFLQRLGREATYGFAARDHSGGGGASQATAEPIYRAWGEVYGIDARTGPQGSFVGDRRSTLGGVAGIGATLAPGFSVGVSVDQSRSRIDVPLALQSATLDLTQIGVNAAYTDGRWTVAFAAVHGFAQIDATRQTLPPFGSARAGYRGSLDGVLGEINYAYTFGQSRIVPKLAVEYVAARTDGFAETGGFNPVTVAAARGERARLLAGAEIGHYWIVGQQAIDVSAYGKLVGNVVQNMGTVQVSLGNTAVFVQGLRESATGADAGAAVSFIMSRTARLYANYDGRFRDGFTSHQGTFGLELKW